VTVVISDNEAQEVIATPASLTLSEPDGQGVFTLTLGSQPTAPVNITLSRDDDTECNVAPVAVQLDDINWDTGRLVTVTVVDDTSSDRTQLCTITGQINTTDPGYSLLPDLTVPITIEDDEPPTTTLHLPLIFQNYAFAPDLVVEELLVATNAVTLTIRNQGAAPVIDGFWVDLYLNPNPPPTAVNQVWYDGRSKEGAAWGIDGAVLSQLTPGGTLTLTIGDAYYNTDAGRSNFNGFEPGDIIYVQVDSVRLDTNYGNILESHEVTGLPYNNLAGPFTFDGLATQPAGETEPTAEPTVEPTAEPTSAPLLED
jgi:hypothetical protein